MKVYVWAEDADGAIDDVLESIWWESPEVARQDKTENPDCYEKGRDTLFEVTVTAEEFK